MVVWRIQGDCIEEERKALLEIKDSFIKLYNSKMDNFLPTWVDYGSGILGDGGGDCCEWERVNCNATTGHVTDLSFYYLRGMIGDNMEFGSKLWPLNVSLFLHFKELRSLNLSYDYLDEEIMKTELERLSSLKKLEVLDLSGNRDIDNDILPSLKTLASLKVLDLSDTSLNGNFPTNELSHLTNLEELELKNTELNETPNSQACKSLSRLKRLESIDLSGNKFNKSIISCLTALPSLKILHLSNSPSLGSSFPVQEFHDLFDLEVLLLRFNGFSGTLPMEGFASFHRLEVLDLSHNSFVGSIPSSIQALSSLRALSFANNELNGSLPEHGFCELNNLHELDLSHNMLDGILPQCFNSLSSLRLLDISSNRFTGKRVPSFIANLTSLEYIDFSHNNFEGSFSFSSFSNHKKLEVVRFRSDNDIFEVETEEPIDWIPMFQLKILELSNCNMKMPKGRIIPGFLLHQHNLRQVDMSHNSLEGQLPNWLIRNNSNLEVLILRDNLFGGMPLHMNANMKWLDVSQNHMIGLIPDWLTNMSSLSELVVRNNSLEGRFPCGAAFFSFLDISQNSFSGPIPSCSNLQYMEHLHLGSNRFTGSIPNFFRNLTNVLTLDIGNNNLSGRIPKFLGELSNLRILLLRKNNFSGLIPRQLCQLSNMSFIDLSANSFSGSIPSCLHNITGPSDLVFLKRSKSLYSYDSSYHYESIIWGLRSIFLGGEALGIQDEVQYTTKSLFLRYKGGILDYMTGLDLSSNKLTGEIPEEVGFLTQLRALNLSHNQLIGLIPVSFSNLAKIESLDLSSNGLTGTIPSELIKLTSLSIFNVSHNSLSGRLPEMKSQFGTFTEESYEGNPLLCGPPLEKKCNTNPHVTNPSAEEDHEKWYDIDMTYFYGSSSSTCFVFLLGFVAILYTNPRWRRRWLDWVEDCIYTCYYFLYDLVWKPSMIFCR
ncbi:unnamed protein product [Lactuca saligna]|uniref:Leucine-rich repeat-containing N-terminal plant-type domain-containing protein n=1 Tax=Lactuca saligna TaxID=75948 RepID=A0AA35VQL7_LACSI|nr:unnamed protein product [Lactuca saligna]